MVHMVPLINGTIFGGTIFAAPVSGMKAAPARGGRGREGFRALAGA
jgi:hypothetical protein